MREEGKGSALDAASSGSGVRRYHHGDLRASLIEAAGKVLAEKGVERFSFRECARRAGVSHAAPAHHFRDVRALLAELAATGFRRLTQAMRERRAASRDDPRSRLVAIGLGYIGFGLAEPELFKLMFGKDRLEEGQGPLKDAAGEAFGELVSAVAALGGMSDPLATATGRRDLAAAWSIVHGYVWLRLNDRLGPPFGTDDAEIAAMLENGIAGLGGAP